MGVRFIRCSFHCALRCVKLAAGDAKGISMSAAACQNFLLSPFKPSFVVHGALYTLSHSGLSRLLITFIFCLDSGVGHHLFKLLIKHPIFRQGQRHHHVLDFGHPLWSPDLHYFHHHGNCSRVRSRHRHWSQVVPRSSTLVARQPKHPSRQNRRLVISEPRSRLHLSF
jgi:hypothetical protein